MASRKGLGSRMRLTIHRGARQVGGNCVELATGDQRILLDIGAPLDLRKGEQPNLPASLNLTPKAGELLGVVVSHSHADHYGLWNHLADTVPVFLGRESLLMLKAAEPFMPVRVPKQAVPYESYQLFKVGPFRITPFLVDHSAYDAHALLVECGGKRLLYTGDLRDHGRKPGALPRLLRDCPRPLEALVIEGTTAGRSDADHPAKTEKQLENELVERIRSATGLVLAFYAAQNIDRFVTFYKATKRAGRTMVIDLYTAELLRALRQAGRKKLPSPRRSDLRIYLPWGMRSRLCDAGNAALAGPYYGRRIYEEALRTGRGKSVMLFRPNMQAEIKKHGLLHDARLIYSMWPGYLDRHLKSLKGWCGRESVEFEIRHVSGHAPFGLLKRVIGTLKPAQLFPIHTEHPQAFAEAFGQTVLLEDGSPHAL